MQKLRAGFLSFSFIAAAFSFLSSGAEAGQISYAVTFNDPGGTYAGYYSAIQSNLAAAGATWGGYLDYTAVVNLQVNFTNEVTMSASSDWSRAVGTTNGLTLLQHGAAAKLMGYARPGGGADAVFNIGTNGYLQNTLWFDPNPTVRTAPVPANKTDAYSRFLHELGHAFALNGSNDRQLGALPPGATYLFQYDQYVVSRTDVVGGTGYPTAYFTGPAARAVYGGDVPLTYGNYTHVGNAAPRAGSVLAAYETLEVMNGVTTYEGTRYGISALDLAMLKDTGLAVTVPEPTTLAAACVIGLLVIGRRPRRRAVTAAA